LTVFFNIYLIPSSNYDPEVFDLVSIFKKIVKDTEKITNFQKLLDSEYGPVDSDERLGFGKKA
jgi:hypothetical protein